MTTSTFTADAASYAESVTLRLILLDGKELARLMVEYSVGVTTARRYEIKPIEQPRLQTPDWRTSSTAMAGISCGSSWGGDNERQRRQP